ncbi:Aminotransferase class I and II/DegT/DnrJ/EryC1/StrS aminotransferase family/Aminotransferase class-V/Cys/Met metabolism PLP-dependent enzyme, putative [Angomonas deanei]|uniref:Aminotransferase class I and II/DegT/DnrJ/EryC1/StrS aminotransferase family/Aminotransferase class-V/Cys/Met metabolism PLP-dependent enzyme, putative n=1 Tax=Angomonas deanei TaxID=59799 RepID=A0A7G2C4E6_9TRYP|nr:Aminotransferase class I and II/DegT/DnrJ/EryC1/StrS aminotransferase family/Aminotransferase class-V/Cys/Met metabolism PLP-dependent enzyme, putative [Angomonas deanei]
MSDAPFEPSRTVQVEENLFSQVYQRQSASNKTQLKMSVGDPTFDGNLVTSPEAVKAHVEIIKTPTNHGYQRFHGHPAACAAVPKYWARRFAPDNAENLKSDNVILTCGGSEAILTAFTALADEGDNILLPSPGFAHYQFVCDVNNITFRFYHTSSETGWEVDLDEVRSLVDNKTKAILVNNPNNPCGSNWSLQHVEAIVKLCEELKLVIIADEIYSGMVSEGLTFSSFANLHTEVPRLIIGGTAKMFMAPGWRLGWILLVDERDYLKDVMKGMRVVSGLSLGPNTITLQALPAILEQTSDSYCAANQREIQNNATTFADAVNQQCKGLSCASPQGALYIMVKVDLAVFTEFPSDVEFYMALEDEENVQVVPGTYLGAPGFFRVCITRPATIIHQVCERLVAFCNRHAK